jgi:hypothetical protein
MARKSVNTTTTTETRRREYDLAHWVEAAKDANASNTRRLYCWAQAITRLCKDEDEQTTPAEDAAYLAEVVGAMAALGTAKALAADAKAGRGVAEVAKRRDSKAVAAENVNLRREIAELLAQLAAKTPAAPETPVTPRKGGRKPVV